jgi:pentatricopeptide repeat protein
MYNTTCKETINTKQRAKVMQSMKLEETKHTEEAARAVAEMDKAKCRATMEVAAAVQRLVDLEAQRRRTAEVRATELHRSNLACLEQLVVDTAVFAGTTNDTVQIIDISLELGVPLHLIKELVLRGPVDVTNSYIRSTWRMHDEEEVVPNTLPNKCLMNCFIGGLDVDSHLWANNSTTADHDRVGLSLLWWLKNHTSLQRFGSWDHFITLGHIFIDLEPLIHSQRTIKHILAIIASISNAQALIFTTSMIWVLCKAGKLREAEELFDQIETEGVVPYAYVYNTILMAFITGGYTAMERITQWNLAFIEHSEQGDRYMELAQ